MMRRLLTTQFTFGVIAVAIMLTGNESCLASGGDSWGGGYGCRGWAGGSWGSRGGFRTPVRNFFAYRQPVRRLVRGVGGIFAYGGSYGCRGWGGSAGYGSTGYGSGGYSYGSHGSVGSYGCTGYSYYSSTGYSYGCVGASTASYASPNCYGYASGVTTYPTMAVQGCTDCTMGVPTTMPAAGDANAPGALSDGAVIGTDQSVIPAEQYYQQGTDGTPTEGTGDGSLRGFESPPTPEPQGDESTSFRRDSILNVSVPEEARIYVNGRLTKTTGSFRQYVSRNLESGKNHRFNLRAAIVRDGKEVSLNKSIAMKAGKNSFVEFDFDQPVLTQLTVKVPENATVKLCGNDTSATGSVRSFKTQLVPGKVWDKYDISVSFEKDGEIVTENREISIEAGQKYVVDFASDKDFYVSK